MNPRELKTWLTLFKVHKLAPCVLSAVLEVAVRTINIMDPKYQICQNCTQR